MARWADTPAGSSIAARAEPITRTASSAQGQGRTPYGFSLKVGSASTRKGNLIAGCARRSTATLRRPHSERATRQATILMQDSAVEASDGVRRSGYGGLDAQNLMCTSCTVAGSNGSASRRKQLRRRSGDKADHGTASRPITTWGTVTSTVRSATDCTRCYCAAGYIWPYCA